MDVVEISPEWEFGNGSLTFRCEVYDQLHTAIRLIIEFSQPSTKIHFTASEIMGGWEADYLVRLLLTTQQDNFSQLNFISEDQGFSLHATAIDGFVPAISATLRSNSSLLFSNSGWEAVFVLRAMRISTEEVIELANLIDRFMTENGVCRSLP